MRKYLTLILLYASFIFQLNAQVELKVEITNLKNDSGKILIQLIDSNQVKVVGKSALINNQKCIITFDQLKEGKYAIRYFHDENSNDQLDTNMFGIPKEGYGMSNEPYGTFGPKDFEKWLVTVDKNTLIQIKTKR